MDLGRREAVRQIEQRREGRWCPLPVDAVTARAVRRVQLSAARRHRPRRTLHLAHDPCHLVRVDVQHRRRGIERGAAPFPPAVQAGEHNRALQARRDELAAAPHRSEALQRGAMCFGRALGEHVLSQSLARERLRYERERLRIGRRSEEHTSELQSQSNLVCRLLLEKKKNITYLASFLMILCNTPSFRRYTCRANPLRDITVPLITLIHALTTLDQPALLRLLSQWRRWS